jgi:hypothetical protein
MSAAQDTLDRLNRSIDRLDRWRDAMGDYQYAKAKRDIAQWRADDSEAEDWRRSKMRKHADRCADHQRCYDEAFEPFGKRAPEPEADAYPPDYRRKLFAIGQSMLPTDHELAQIGDPRDLDRSAIIPFEQQLFEALRKEAEQPTGDNLPESPDDPRARREVRDDSGRVAIIYKAKNSFIKGMGRPGMRVLRFCNPKTGQVLFGPPFPVMPGR